MLFDVGLLVNGSKYIQVFCTRAYVLYYVPHGRLFLTSP